MSITLADISAYYRLDGNFTDSAHGRNLGPQGTVTFAAGKISLGLASGTGNVLSNWSGVNAPPFTIAYWAKPAGVGSSPGGVQFNFGNNAYSLLFLPNGTVEVAHGKTIATVGNIPTNVFSHIGITVLPGGVFTLYINGQVDFSDTSLPPTLFSSLNLLTPSSPSGLILDEVLIGNRIYTQVEMNQLYNSGHGWDPTSGPPDLDVVPSIYLALSLEGGWAADD